MEEKEKNQLKRRVLESLTKGPAEEKQHLIYDFLLELETFADRLDKLDSVITQIQTTIEPLAKFNGLKDKLKNGALVVLAAYFLKDSPEVLKFVVDALSAL